MRQETGTGRRFKGIKAWQKADDLVALIYRATRTFPREEQYGLTSQMRRAAISVAANIVEGSARRSKQEYLQFLGIAKASLSELSYYVHLSTRLAYLPASQFHTEKLDGLCEETARVLYGLMQAVSQDRLDVVAAADQ